MNAAPAASPAELAPPRVAAFARWAPYVGMVSAALPLRVWAAVHDQGLFWPDEIYQSLEQAHRLAFGNGLIPWEFQQGARSWLFPGLLGGVYKLAAALGVHDALTLVIIAKLVIVAAGLVSVVAAMKLAEKLSGPSGALIAGALCATFPGITVYAARCMTETFSGPFLVGAALLALAPGTRRAAFAGALAGLAVFIRYQNGLVTAGLLILLLAQRRKPDAIRYALAAGAVGLAGGLLDWATWGRPFQSFIHYLVFNLVEGKASQWGTAPFSYYFTTAWTSTGPAVLLIPLGLAFAWTRARGLLLIVLAFFLAHCLIPHKEYRFLAPILPLALGLAGAGLGELWKRFDAPVWSAAALAVALFLIGYPQARAETFARMGQYLDNAGGQRSVWHADEDVNLVLLDAGRRTDLCGLIVTGIHPAWMGGYTYLHRDVPMYFRGGPEELAGSNYVVGRKGTRMPEGWSEVSGSGSFSLFRRDGGCAPRPAGWKPLLP